MYDYLYFDFTKAIFVATLYDLKFSTPKCLGLLYPSGINTLKGN